MESIKPVIEDSVIRALLGDLFEQPIHTLAPVEGGQMSQTRAFQVGDVAYILRFTTSDLEEGYQKDAFIYNNFASPNLPVPPIVKIGQHEDLHYAISEKMPGNILSALTRETYNKTLASIIQTLCAIHQSDISQWAGYGAIDVNGMGTASSWKNFIAAIKHEQHQGSFYGEWHSLFETTILERDFFDTVYAHMMHLRDACPEERYLLHGDFGYDNVLAEGEQNYSSHRLGQHQVRRFCL